MGAELAIGFLPLVDACLPILAREHGFAEAEGISLKLVRDMSWATVLDRLLYGHSDAAHLVAPLAIATTLGRGRPAVPLSVPFVLGLNGNAITMRTALAERVCPAGRLGDPRAVGAALKDVAAERKAAGNPLRFGVVHRYSSHNYMLRYWLAACGIRPDKDVEIATVAPPFCSDALEAGEVDVICVGEPWNSVAVERGAGRIVLVTAQIWRRGVEKVLALREPVLKERRGEVEALLRALVAAARHFVSPENWDSNAAILARPEYLDGSPSLIRRAISDRILLARGGEPVHYPDFMFQHREAANFPWVSQAEWLYTQMVRWEGMEFDPEMARKAARVFRPDVYRSALLGSGEPLPGASSKVEGSLGGLTSVGTQQGVMTLENNQFFDGRAFDPHDLQGYLASQA
ncbi:nitrate transporter component, nrtA [Novosphingobium aromaticivorans DSM 12444]|uniref:Nitrate transporter component, nrtA n=1 Tax=Novosphingobium aromaticivorans (strain ATCC 700278 / DSM 12444 / CCUG 56034 / CIP 105152 / NBRC 16084 / F199) TaxID=279238 RepID=Q2G416_NOVAD|nr:CmpA/NrtA family ABC transporter substrate-binding protein [Novosphingobium aromaticivorans]ABD27407.1 nitrate transporter component, nrtA [Novosphingobium aromaticivorans DSM 12444]SCY68709.1 NitT/TauT family transport system ATP-binding protein [Novosphingobium aromaticivorans]